MISQPDGLQKMIVDEERCIGAGQCEMLEQETFYVDDDTAIANVIGTGTLPKDQADQAIAACPAQAISSVPASEISPVAEHQPAQDPPPSVSDQ